ncbi:MAG: hypothetical protein H8E47_07460 [Anaerolineales bacterium]|nr:hypothetical protein [Anaerolineales bacterium]
MNASNEVLESTIAELQLLANNGGIASLSAEEAQGILDELERLSNFERAYHSEVHAYATLVKGVDMEYDEMTDLIADLLEQLKQTVDSLAHWFPRRGDPEGADSQMMINARNMIAKAKEYLEHYHKHMK